jgi:hypothetical protein
MTRCSGSNGRWIPLQEARIDAIYHHGHHDKGVILALKPEALMAPALLVALGLLAAAEDEK